MRLKIFRIGLLLWLASSLSWRSAPVHGAEGEQADQSLAEHSGEIFFGTIDIVTTVLPITTGAGSAMTTEYTVLVSDVLKGNLRPQTMVVVRQNGGNGDFVDGDGPLAPGAEYLFFTYYDPALLRYVIAEPAIGNIVIMSPEQRDELTTHWSAVVEQTTCGYTDVLKLDGVVYARRDWNDDKRYLEREWVGPTIATVDRQDTTATSCRTDLTDRTASRIPTGTKIQSVDGYAPTFRVAVRMPDRHRYLYEAIRSAKAKTGADLLDIKDRVASIDFELGTACDDDQMCDAPTGTISSRATVTKVVTMLLESPVEFDAGLMRNLPSEWVKLTLTLDDASTVTIWINRETGESQCGIRVPVDDLLAQLRTA